MVFVEGSGSNLPRREQGEIPNNFNIAVLVSPKSSGSNLRAIYAAESETDMIGRVVVVVADRPSAPAFTFANEKQIPTAVLRYRVSEGANPEEYRNGYSAELAYLLDSYNTDIAVMAGFNRILRAPFFEKFKKPLLNIHPGAIPDKKDEPFVFDGIELPWNQGKMAEAAVENFLHLPWASSTIHEATEEADFGPVLKRVFVPVEPGDTVDSLYGRLKLAEHKGLVEVLKNPPITQK